MLEFFANQGGWGWALAGIILVGLEMFAPGMFLIWLGLAAFLTSLLVGLFGLGWQASALAFAILAVASVVTGRRLSRTGRDLPEGARHLNARGQQLIGQSFRLDRPLMNGEGQLKIGDSVWRITGPDMVAGANVKVMRVDGATLVVEAG
jgi:membrane protein implicated in regulation of membrane protease activity